MTSYDDLPRPLPKCGFGAEDAIQLAASQFPEHFGLRAFRGTFRVSLCSSYVRDDQQEVVLYLQRQTDSGDWCDFVKGTPSELRAEIRR